MRWSASFFYRAPVELVETYKSEATVIYEGVVYGPVNEVKEENNDHRVCLVSGEKWSLGNIFRNPRIKCGNGDWYTKNSIEEDSLKGSDFGVCLGTPEEAALRGYRLMTRAEREKYDQRRGGASVIRLLRAG